MRVCSTHGCPELYPASQGSRCPTHQAQADKARGAARQRGYNSKGHHAFRTAVIHRDPVCVACHLRPSTVADHHPHGRDELIRLALNPNDPRYGRGLCAPCHGRATVANQPGGWHTP
ncbi:5-methylcytosine-specific restriction protein A [Leucobacter luti]|uniref:5-methylcytosine-specific restriction protein A n=1 Tax=Leucobacter luti TaxID=340320 RepID=A0A4R6S4K8_9MICO|nr:5-methylcytosine-specific restriction protein A [Leucobacter luti]